MLSPYRAHDVVREECFSAIPRLSTRFAITVTYSKDCDDSPP